MAAAEDLPNNCWDIIGNKLLEGRGRKNLDLDNRSVNNLSLVSKRFLFITMFVRRRINLRNITHHDRHHIPRFLNSNRYPNVRTLYIDFQTVQSNIFKDVSDSGLDLHELDILCGSQSRPTISRWGLLGQTLENLKVLKFRNSGRMRDQDLIAIGDALPMLEELDISIIINSNSISKVNVNLLVSDYGIEEVSKKLIKLKIIDVSGMQRLTDRSIIALCKNCVFLTQCRFRNCSRISMTNMQIKEYFSAHVLKYTKKNMCFYFKAGHGSNKRVRLA